MDQRRSIPSISLIVFIVVQDRQLISLVDMFGRKWTQIGILLDRSEAQCAMRYNLQLDPRLKFKLWTIDEDQRLLSLRNELGYSFAMISAVLSRTGPSCRYRYAKLSRTLEIKNSR